MTTMTNISLSPQSIVTHRIPIGFSYNITVEWTSQVSYQDS